MAGYSGKPLASKLGIKTGTVLCAVGAPRDYLELLAPLPDGVSIVSDSSIEAADILHAFFSRKEAMAGALADYRALIRPTTAVWISWPKKASRVPADITEEAIRELALPLGFVDTKVCAVTEIWSGLRLVIRKELR